MTVHYLPTTKTARYFTLGELTETTQEVWLVLHGYAQLASDFIQAFDVLDNGTRYIVAPEGLNRFYAKGFGGRPAATWMTSEDRHHEISDYLLYLETLYTSLHIGPGVRITVLGFSQGVATASRFVHHTQQRVDALVACSGELAAELTDPLSGRLGSIPLTYVTGNADPFITPEKHAQVHALMARLNARIVTFEGGHEVKRDVLQQLA